MLKLATNQKKKIHYLSRKKERHPMFIKVEIKPHPLGRGFI